MKSVFRASAKDGKHPDLMVHQHMLAHYRRLYSAKCGVDTSTPAHFKPRYKPKVRPSLPTAEMSVQPQLTNKDLIFLKSLAGEVRSWWSQSGSRQHCRDKNNGERSTETGKISTQDKNHFHSYDLHSSSRHGIAPLSVKTTPKKRKDLDFRRCALAYGASSKLREMSVYHPPRRRLGTGVSSNQCGQCASRINQDSQLHSSGDIETSNLFANEISTVIDKQKEELLYLQFIQDITQDVLNNDIYSNEGLMVVFKKHLSLNREKLDRDKMIKEVEKLGVNIGLPQFNYPTLITSNRLPLSTSGENDEENGEYEYYVDYRPKVKSCNSASFDRKSKFHGDFNVSLSSSLSDNEIGLIKEGDIFDKKKKESKVLGFLEEMGFDSNIAEEICVCMTDKDFSKFQFAPNESETSPSFHNDFISSREIEDYNCKKDHKSKSVTELFHLCDRGYIFEDVDKTQDVLFDPVDTMEMEKILEAMNENEVTQDDDGSVKAGSVSAPSKSRESERGTTLKTELLEECVQEEHKKSITEQNSKVNSSSPMGSDYSSMKDHDGSISEGYSEEQDGHDNASEEAEEIPEDLSQSSISSGISQITEKLKGFSVDVNSILHKRSKERNTLSENNNHSLRELVL